ncbi:uncharacterized protein BJX67DRAFT_342727 [Aspergillus lucknowensis]|uniref:Uncharacterized protein n=1 Tax=Aspergillus lucknowensis TaxID=176173 RepID=A0ABR4M4V0_9EURO
MKTSPLLSYLAFISGSALAATVKQPSACVTDTNQLLITGLYCGAGESVTFTGDATAVTNQQCFTQSGNPVQGVPKKRSESVSIGPTTIDPTDTGCVPICIESDEVVPTLQCTGTQKAQIVGSVSFTDVSITGSNLPKPITFKSVTNKCTESELACLP